MSDEVFQEESSLTCTPLNASQDNMALVCKVCNTVTEILSHYKNLCFWKSGWISKTFIYYSNTFLLSGTDIRVNLTVTSLENKTKP